MTAPHRTAQRPSDASARHHNLPAPHTQLIGREHDCATVLELVQQTPGRLVTLTGTGGCGKTQLALLVAAGLVDRFADGVWLVDLAPVQAPNLVLYAVAAVLGRRERAGEALLDTLVAYLAGRELLLVLDNCEHLIDACAETVDAILRRCPGVYLLTTSREPLGIGGETIYRVPSLSLPGPDAADSPWSGDAVALFVQRAKEQGVDLPVDEQTAPLLVSICRRLDGLPLAIELAAARLRSISLNDLRDRLDHRFRLLTGGSRVALERQQTLRATVDWS
jgi:predicted ATPase